jgi:glycosidase
VFIALDSDPARGTRIAPFSRGEEGSTVFLPVPIERLVVASPAKQTVRTHGPWSWSGAEPLAAPPTAWQPGSVVVRLPAPSQGAVVRAVAWAKDLAANDGWGRLAGASDPSVEPGEGDRLLLRAHRLSLGAFAQPAELEALPRRPFIYQLLPRLFSNTNETRAPNGSLAQNGSGTFQGIDARALAGIRELGATHVWLTGVPRQATSTDYSRFGMPADDADLLKGLAGSPYAIRDYFDVCPDYAVDVERRREEFTDLIARARSAGLKVLIDFVPNHVARSYASVVRPEHDFGRMGRGGAGDDASVFFLPSNNFFYVQPGDRMRGEQAPLKLPSFNLLRRIPLSPTARVLSDRVDGLFEPEARHVKVTGSNLASFSPPLDSWYETVKLNFGFDYARGTRAHPGPQAPALSVPDTWMKMDAVIAHWQALGVDGFRCDMAHMVPIEFWRWLITRARERSPEVFFCAEAYDDDPARVPPLAPLEAAFGSTKVALIAAGFDAVYDDPSYDRLKDVFERGASVDALASTTGMPLLQAGGLRYAENHDEVRLASPSQWGGVGRQAGPALTALLWSLGPGPVLLYHGQEVGEPAAGVEGFGGDDSRTSIFDYWSMPEFAKWVNGGAFDGGRLDDSQRALRRAYVELGALVGEPALQAGSMRLVPTRERTTAVVLRHDPVGGQTWLVVANLSPSSAVDGLDLDLQVRAAPGTARLRFPSGAAATLSVSQSSLGVRARVGALPPLTTAIWELR